MPKIENGMCKTVKEAFDMIHGYFQGGASIENIFIASKSFKSLLDPRYANFFNTEIIKIRYYPGAESVVIIQKEWNEAEGGEVEIFEDIYKREGSTWILYKRGKSFDYGIPTDATIYWNKSYISK
jgi:hypothetical protein